MFHDPPPLAAQLQTPRIEAAVGQALSENRIELAYQPVVMGSDTGVVAFYEGLLRLRHRDGGYQSAGAFLPAVETRPLGRVLDSWALQMGLLEMQRVPHLRLAINVSPRSLRDPRWWSTLTTGLAEDPHLAERLILEITECASLRSHDMPEIFQRLRGQGVSVALDDFGAGCTCFGNLRDLRFDILKIDGQFTKDVHQNRDNQVLFKSLLTIARHFELLTVAECVESHAEAAYLCFNGIDCLQGYAFGRPKPKPSWPEHSLSPSDLHFSASR